MAKFYITTAIPYVNAKPHIGHALEFVQADVIARYHKLTKPNTLLLSGGDENALKNVQAAEKEKVPVQQFVDNNSKLFSDLAEKLEIHFDVFQKGSDAKHHSSSQRLWELCNKNGDIYKKEYKGLYCVGCELFYEKEELNEKGECFEHLGKKLEEITELNYFFRLSNYQSKIENLIESGKLKITPENRNNEALSFIKQGLKDISISRSNERAKNWGVDVPNDSTQKMYVWFDALNIYQSGVGFPLDKEKYKKWWPADLHIIGKGILRFHAIYWPAFLLSAGLEPPKELFVHGYLTVDGQKMSKTIGNVIDPQDLIEKYGADALRYYLLKEISPYDDGDFSEEKFKRVYNADLANGLGNLVARVAKLCEKNNYKTTKVSKIFPRSKVLEKLNDFRFNEALSYINEEVSRLNRRINEESPWILKGRQLQNELDYYIPSIRLIAGDLQVFLPETSKKILAQFSSKITSQKPLFPRK